MEEVWETVKDFPRYMVSNFGRIMNEESGHILAKTRNQRSLLMVGMMRDGVQHKRSVSHLVMNAHGPPQPSEPFDSIIHLNGDVDDCQVENLAWRPRWFCHKYHQQFAKDVMLKTAIYIFDTDETMRHSREVAMTYGLLELDVVNAILDETPVWPVRYELRLARPV